MEQGKIEGCSNRSLVKQKKKCERKRRIRKIKKGVEEEVLQSSSVGCWLRLQSQVATKQSS